MKKSVKKMEFLRKVRALLLTALAALAVGGCSYNNYLMPQDFARQLSKDGLDVIATRPLDPLPLGATAALEIKVGNSNIGVYKYDITIRKHKERLERIKKSQRVFFTGIPYPIYEVSGSFIVVGLDKHKDKERILKSLRNFK